MSKEKVQEYERAVELLEKSDLNKAEQVAIISLLSNQRADDHPFVRPEFKAGRIDWWKSDLDVLSGFGFQSEGEVVLANAIALNMAENFSPNDFPHQFKAILRILGVESVWAE